MCQQISDSLLAKLEKTHGAEELRKVLTEDSNCASCCYRERIGSGEGLSSCLLFHQTRFRNSLLHLLRKIGV
jgi:hypothetical protein